MLVSELVTNAVIHARTGATVHVARHDRTIEFGVSDRSPGRCSYLPSVEPVTGRGIYFLDQLAPDWEVLSSGDGKRIRFSLSVDAMSAVSR